MDCQSTNSAGSLFHVNELLEIFPEVTDAVMTIEERSIGKWFVITETTGGLVSGSSWDRPRL